MDELISDTLIEILQWAGCAFAVTTGIGLGLIVVIEIMEWMERR